MPLFAVASSVALRKTDSREVDEGTSDVLPFWVDSDVSLEVGPDFVVAVGLGGLRVDAEDDSRVVALAPDSLLAPSPELSGCAILIAARSTRSRGLSRPALLDDGAADSLGTRGSAWARSRGVDEVERSSFEVEGAEPSADPKRRAPNVRAAQRLCGPMRSSARRTAAVCS